MTIKRLIHVAAAVVLLGAFGTANAVSISMVPSTSDVALGQTLTIEIFGDFSDDPTVGGGFDIIYDATSLQVTNFEQAPVGDPDFTSLGGIDNAAGRVGSVAFGSFAGVGGANFLIATMTIEVIGAFTDTMIAMQDNGDAAGPFFSAVTFGQQTVNYSGATLSQTVIPVPAAVWLMMGGLGALFGFGRKKA